MRDFGAAVDQVCGPVTQTVRNWAGVLGKITEQQRQNSVLPQKVFLFDTFSLFTKKKYVRLKK